jgi:hypothetical protein
VLFGFLAAAVEAKRKRKFEGDFEFAEEVSGDPYYCSYINHVCLLHCIVGTGTFFVTILSLILDFGSFCQVPLLSK